MVTCAQIACLYADRPIKLPALMRQTELHKQLSFMGRHRVDTLIDRVYKAVTPHFARTDLPSLGKGKRS